MSLLQLESIEKRLKIEYGIEVKLHTPADIKWYLDYYKTKLEIIDKPQFIVTGNIVAKDCQSSTIATKYNFVYKTLVLPELSEENVSRIKIGIDSFSRIYSIVRINDKNILTYLKPISTKPCIEDIEFIFLRPGAKTEISLQDNLVYFGTLEINNESILVFYKKRY